MFWKRKFFSASRLQSVLQGVLKDILDFLIPELSLNLLWMSGVKYIIGCCLQNIRSLGALKPNNSYNGV